MSVLRRKRRTAPIDTVVACTAPGVDHVEIDYDPADWAPVHGADAMATFVTSDRDGTRQSVASIRVLDDELMMLENGDPEAFLGFADDPSRAPEKPRWVAKRYRFSARGGIDDSGSRVRVTHLHRQLDTDPTLHVVGNVVGSGGASLQIMQLFSAVHVHMSDGRVL